MDFHTYIVEGLASDRIDDCVIKDRSILNLLGRALFDRLGRERSSEIRYRLRLLARLKFELKQIIPNWVEEDLEKSLIPQNFDFIIVEAKHIAQVSEEKSLNGVMMFGKPEVARKLVIMYEDCCA